jgi:hypothetical protein
MHGEAGSTHSHSHVVKVVIWERLQELRLFNRYEISRLGAFKPMGHVNNTCM